MSQHYDHTHVATTASGNYPNVAVDPGNKKYPANVYIDLRSGSTTRMASGTNPEPLLVTVPDRAPSEGKPEEEPGAQYATCRAQASTEAGVSTTTTSSGVSYS